MLCARVVQHLSSKPVSLRSTEGLCRARAGMAHLGAEGCLRLTATLPELQSRPQNIAHDPAHIRLPGDHLCLGQNQHLHALCMIHMPPGSVLE